MVKKFSLLLLTVIILSFLASCGTNEKTIMGNWYNPDENDYLIIESDHTYKMKHHPGASYDYTCDHGTWQWLEQEKYYKFTDSEGYVQNVEIKKENDKLNIIYDPFGTFEKQ